MAEWLRRGLQILARRFDSGSGLQYPVSRRVLMARPRMPSGPAMPRRLPPRGLSVSSGGMMEPSPSMAYRHDIDGLRAIAVVTVVIFHLFHNALPQGFLGVDIFFVISGYLICGILLRDIEKRQFSIVRFYERRIRRIAPAMLAVLLATSIAAAAILLPRDLEGYGKSLIASLAFVANIYFWRDSDYFSRAAENKPLLHFWSLGIEEQFYIFFPILLFFLARNRRLLLPSIWLLTVGSLIANVGLLKMGGANPAFYLLPTRAWELGAGVLVAIHGVAPLSPQARRAPRILGLALLLGGLFYSGEWPLWLPVAVPVVLGTALLIWVGASSDSLSGRFFALPPINLTGRISYSLYLWHWPLIVLTKYYLVRDLRIAEAIAIAAIAAILALLSWKYIEQPFRTSKTSFQKVAGYSTGGALAAVATSVLFIASAGLPGRLNAEAASINRSVDSHYRCPVARLIPFGASRACDLTLAGRGIENARVALIGNSHAQMYAPVVAELLRERNVAAVLIPINACLPMPTVNISIECADAARTNLDSLRSLPHIETVIIAFNWPLDQLLVDAAGQPLAQAPASAMVAGMRDLVDRLPGRQVIVVGPIAQPGFDIASVLGRQIAFGIRPLAESSTSAESFRKRFAAILSYLDSDDRIIAVRPDLVQCDRTQCDYVRDGISLFSDSNHLAGAALPLFRPAFDSSFKQLDENGRR